jgi:hypothetical protein
MNLVDVMMVCIKKKEERKKVEKKKNVKRNYLDVVMMALA